MAQTAHKHEVNVSAVAPDLLPEATLLDEAGSSVGANGSGVGGRAG
jgi:hypothetical protein